MTVLALIGADRAASRRSTIAQWIEAHRQRAALARLSDDMLADIGMTREAADREAARPFWDI